MGCQPAWGLRTENWELRIGKPNFCDHLQCEWKESEVHMCGPHLLPQIPPERGTLESKRSAWVGPTRLTSEPMAITTPAPSWPATNGSGAL